MVTTTDTTEIVTQPKTEEVNQPSFKRWLKHFLYMPATKRYFSKQDQAAIAQAVAEAEHDHVGEIQVVIEVDDTVRRGVVTLPHGYGARYRDSAPVGPPVNRLTASSHCDPFSKTPFHKYVPVRIWRLSKN